jgi:hypothetical protein
MHIAFCGFFDWAEPMDIGGWVVSEHYMWGVFGSIIVEVGAVVRATSNNDGRCPPPYNRPFYVVVRAVFAILAGLLPIALNASNALTAFYLGASAPLVVERATAGIEPQRMKKTPARH